MAIELFRVILPVPDIARGESFYAQLFESPGERISPGRHYFRLGATILALYDPVADGDSMAGGWKHHPNQYVYFSTPELDAAWERAQRAGVQELTSIDEKPWGERIFYGRDPFGNPISFVDSSTVFQGH